MIADATTVDHPGLKVGYLRGGQPYPVSVEIDGSTLVLSTLEAKETAYRLQREETD